MKVGDTHTVHVDNGTPDGIVMTGKIVELSDDTVTVATQLGFKVTLPRPKEVPATVVP